MKCSARNRIGWAALLLTLLLAGCSGPAFVSPKTPITAAPESVSSPTSRFPDLTEQALKNADYSTGELSQFLGEADRKTPIRLKDGQFHYIYTAGAATELVIQFVQSTGGDLDADGRNDAAVVLRVLPGGSGAFYFLAAIINRSGEPQMASAVLLGDRVKLDTLTIADGKVKVDLVTQGPTDPMCCPSQKTQRVFQLKNGALVDAAAAVN